MAFRSSSSDPDGRIASYAWAFGDGAHSTASSPSHRGRYTVRLTVVGAGGQRSIVRRRVRVR